MEQVLDKARELAEAILASEEYTKMHQAEQAALKDEKASLLIAAYTEKRHAVEELLASADMDKGDLAEAGEALENVEHAIEENEVLNRMRVTNQAFSNMMEKVNSLIQFVVTGKVPEQEEGCTGSCASCHADCGHHH